MEYGLGLILSITALVFGLPFFIRGLRLKLKKGKEYRGSACYYIWSLYAGLSVLYAAVEGRNALG